MNVVFVNRYFAPDTSATSQLLTDLAAGLSGDFDLTVVASRCLHDDVAARLPAQERHAGVDIVRTWSTAFGRSSGRLRALDYFSFWLSVCWLLLRRVRQGDIVVLKTDPPLLQLFSTAVVRMKGGKAINWLQDIYPEIAVRLGAFPGPAFLADWLMRWRDRALRGAAASVVVSPRMKAYLGKRGVNNTRVLPNWAVETVAGPVPREASPLRRHWGLDERFIVMYSGNFGRVHAFDEIRAAMRLLADDARIAFVLVGAGAGLSGLKADAAAMGLKNVMFLPLQPVELLRDSLGAADLHLVSLHPGMEDLVMPSKFYGILAAGRAVAYIGEPDSDISRMIREFNLGFSVVNGDGEGLAQGIRELAAHPHRLRDAGMNSRRVYESRYLRSQRLHEWRDLFRSLSMPREAG